MTSRIVAPGAMIAVLALAAADLGTAARACVIESPSLADSGPNVWDGRDDIPANWVYTSVAPSFATDFATDVTWWMRAPGADWVPLSITASNGVYFVAPSSPVPPWEYEVKSLWSDLEEMSAAEIHALKPAASGTFTVVEREAAPLVQPILEGIESQANLSFSPFACGRPAQTNHTDIIFRYVRDPAAVVYALRGEDGAIEAIHALPPETGRRIELTVAERDAGRQTFALEVYDHSGRVLRTDVFGDAGCPGACSQSGNRAPFVALFALLWTLRRRHAFRRRR